MIDEGFVWKSLKNFKFTKILTVLIFTVIKT